MSWEVRTMRSGTSFFNTALFRKTFLRFWPIWALYTAGWTLVLPLRLWADAMRWKGSSTPKELAECLQNAVSQIPYLLEVGVALAALGCLALWPLVQWLLAQGGLCLFFYSFAVFCAMFTGHLAALPVFYGVLNLLAFLMTSLVEAVCDLFLYGFRSFPSPVWELVDHLSPPVILSNAVSIVSRDDAFVLYQPGLVAVYAAAGVALSIAALLIYRSRHIESAGDVVAVKLVRPLFKYGVALCAGLTGGMFTYELLSGLSDLTLMGWILFWGLAGYFAAEMLLRKSFRVLAAWKGAVPLAAVIVLLSLSVHYDWYGFEDRVPQADQVTAVTLNGLHSAPYDDGQGRGLTLEDPEQIALVLQLHRAALALEEENREEESDPQGYTEYLYEESDPQGYTEYLYLDLHYELADGTALERGYSALPIVESDRGVEGTLTWAAGQLLSDRENMEQLYGFHDIEANCRLVAAYLEDVWNTQTRQYETVYIDGSTEKLWQAMKQDFAEGTIGVRYLFDNSVERMENTCATDLYFDYEAPPKPGDVGISSYGSSFSITLTPQASHTLALLHELKVLDETHLALTNREAEALELGEGGAYAPSTQAEAVIEGYGF